MTTCAWEATALLMPQRSRPVRKGGSASPQRPMLLVADPATGRVYEHPTLELALDNGLDTVRPGKKDLIDVPEGWDLMAMPGTRPIGYDPSAGRFVTVKELTVDGLDTASAGAVVGSVLAVLLLCAPPVVLLGMVSPFAIRLAISDVATAGAVAKTTLTPARSRRRAQVMLFFSSKRAAISTRNSPPGSGRRGRNSISSGSIPRRRITASVRLTVRSLT